MMFQVLPTTSGAENSDLTEEQKVQVGYACSFISILPFSVILTYRPVFSKLGRLILH